MIKALRVTPSELERAATSFESTGGEVNNLTNQMLALVSEIAGAVWSGEAATSYKSKFAALQDDITKMNKMITEHVTDLRAMANEFKSAEEANKELANALSDSVIS